MLIFSGKPGLVASYTPKPKIKKDKKRFYFTENTYCFHKSEKRRRMLKNVKASFSTLPKDISKMESFFNLLTTTVLKRYT